MWTTVELGTRTKLFCGVTFHKRCYVLVNGKRVLRNSQGQLRVFPTRKAAESERSKLNEDTPLFEVLHE